MNKANQVLSKVKSLNESNNSMSLDPMSGEDRAKLIQAAENNNLVVISERDKDGYVVIEVAPVSLAASKFTQHAKSDLKAKFTVV